MWSRLIKGKNGCTPAVCPPTPGVRKNNEQRCFLQKQNQSHSSNLPHTWARSLPSVWPVGFQNQVTAMLSTFHCWVMGVVGGTRDTVHLSLILKSLREESPRLTLTDITVHHLAVSGCIDGMGSWGFSQGKGLVLHVWEEGSREPCVN